MRKFKCWQSNASPGIPERLKRKARHTENKKKKKEENPHKQSGRSENAGGDRGGLAKWFKTQLKF